MEVRESNLHVGDLAIPISSIRSIHPTRKEAHVRKVGDILAVGLASLLVEVAGRR